MRLKFSIKSSNNLENLYFQWREFGHNIVSEFFSIFFFPGVVLRIGEEVPMWSWCLKILLQFSHEVTGRNSGKDQLNSLKFEWKFSQDTNLFLEAIPHSFHQYCHNTILTVLISYSKFLHLCTRRLQKAHQNLHLHFVFECCEVYSTSTYYDESIFLALAYCIDLRLSSSFFCFYEFWWFSMIWHRGWRVWSALNFS